MRILTSRGGEVSTEFALGSELSRVPWASASGAENAETIQSIAANPTALARRIMRGASNMLVTGYQSDGARVGQRIDGLRQGLR
jgi:hypothetical protein